MASGCELTESDVWSGLDRNAPEMADHLATCETCQTRARAFRTTVGAVTSVCASNPPSLPSSIGPYVVHRRLGEGGMGIVYEAEQQSPQRLVAIKVVRGGAQVDDYRLRLFQREAQTLGRLKHPNIAAIYEGGRTVDGEHYIAMELVNGIPLTQYVRDHKVPRRARLRLFQQICMAIQYAHQRGVIHRDLKPSNILIDVEGRPKILDFGLARITDPEGTLATATYEFGRVMGTLPYMSPEEVRGDVGLIDVRSDLYSLGVILYELLTDELPYTVRRQALPQAIRVICEEEPRWASSIDRTLRGDLDMILFKALQKEQNRRYQSATALAEDIDRFLTDQPVSARRGNALYVLRKMLVRHRLAAIAVGGVVAVLLMAAFAITEITQSQRSGVEDTLASQDFRIATYQNRFADALLELGRTAEAEPVYRSAVDTFLYLQRDELAAPAMEKLAGILMDKAEPAAQDLSDAESLLLDADDIYGEQGPSGIDSRRRVLKQLLKLYGPQHMNAPDSRLEIEMELAGLDALKSAQRAVSTDLAAK